MFRRRFQREVTAARTVSPLYTAAVVEADTAATAPWFATAYIDGPSLSTLVEASGPLALGAVLTLAAGLAEGLASIHEAGLVHRDLAPSNIILDDSGPHIIDFGIAFDPQSTKLTADQRLVGTPSYIAPEVIEGNEAGPPSDVFAFGAILAFAASGKHLIAPGPLPAQILQIIRARFDFKGIPQQIRPLIVRCTAVRPQDRPTAAELVRILVGARVAKPSPGWFTSGAGASSIKFPPLRPQRMSRRGVLLTLGVAGLAAGATGAAAWAGAFTTGPDHNAAPSSPTTRTPTPATPTPSRTGSGTVAWRARSGVMPVGLSSAGPQSPTRIIVHRGERLIAANSSEVFCVALDGTRMWTQTLPTGSVNLWGWGDQVLVSDSRRLWLIDASSGDTRFAINAVDEETVEAQGDNPDEVPIQLTGVALAPETAFVGLGTATIALNRLGERVWRRPRPNPRNGVRPPEGAPVAAHNGWLVKPLDFDVIAVNLGAAS